MGELNSICTIYNVPVIFLFVRPTTENGVVLESSVHGMPRGLWTFPCSRTQSTFLIIYLVLYFYCEKHSQALSGRPENFK